MKNKYSPLTSLLGFLIGSALTGCKREPAEPAAPPSVRVFTNRAEITDEAVKAKFLKQANTAAPFQQTIPATSTEKINFIKPDTVTFGSSTLKYSVVRGSNYLFYSPLGLRLNNNDLWLSELLKYTAPKYPLAPGAGGADYITQEVRVGTGDSKQIRLSVLQYYRSQKLSFNGATVVNQAAGVVLNEFNEAGISTIRSTDTVAIRTGSILYLTQ